VVETIAVDIQGFAAIDAAFAYDYGEWDRTWRVGERIAGSSMRHAATP